MLLGACNESVDPNDPVTPETADITATVLTRNAEGQQVTMTETFTQDQFEAMIAARVARQSIQAPGDTQPAGPGIIRSSNLDCTTPSSIAGFPVWGARGNTPNCTNGRFALLSDSPISCWIP